MKHSIHTSLSSLGLAAVLLLAPSCASTKSADAMDPEAMMQRQMELAAPGPEHEALAKHAGTWEVTYKYRWAPDAEWMETVGTTHASMDLGGRFLREESNFEIEGMPIQGMHMIGYDNLAGEYISLWSDTMSTWWTTSRGRKDAQGRIDMRGTMVDAAGTRPFRMVLQEQSDGSMTCEMYDTIPPGGEVLVMTTVAKRRW